MHIPVLPKEVLEYLALKPNQNVIDCNLGFGGHAALMLQAIGPNGKLVGFDLDESALEQVRTNFNKSKEFEKRVYFLHRNFAELSSALAELPQFPIHAVLFDLGMSSLQLDDPKRGFSFKKGETLDMRFSKNQELTAHQILNRYSHPELAKILREYGELRNAGTLARRIIEARKKHPIDTPSMLVKAISSASFRFVSEKDTFESALLARGKHPVVQVFQALRIAVNDELKNLQAALPQALELLEAGGRIAIISFHSLEDRIVKNFFRDESKNCLCKNDIPLCQCNHRARLRIITKKPITPKQNEVQDNSRARSAKLRVAERI